MHWGTSYPVSAQCRSCRLKGLYLQICWLKTLLFSLLFFSPPLSLCWICSEAVPFCRLPSSLFLTGCVFIEHPLSIFLLWYDKKQRCSSHLCLHFCPNIFNIRRHLVVHAFPIKFRAGENDFTSSSDTKAYSLCHLLSVTFSVSSFHQYCKLVLFWKQKMELQSSDYIFVHSGLSPV